MSRKASKTLYRYLVRYLLMQAHSLYVEHNNFVFLSWADIAQKIGMDPANLSRIVTGVTVPRTDTFIMILDALGCKLTVEHGEQVSEKD